MPGEADNGDEQNDRPPPVNETSVHNGNHHVAAQVLNVELSPSKEAWWDMICLEARCVSVWALLAPLVRVLIALLSQAASVTSDTLSCSPPKLCTEPEQRGIISVAASWILYFLPRSVAQAPGFVFASAWLLFAIRDHFGSTPNVSIRICEAIMGRLSFRDLFMLLPIHFVCTISTFMVLTKVLPSDNMVSMALAPLSYSQDNPWLMDVIREALVNCAFTVSFLVLPELCALNRIPRFVSGLVMYPLYSFGVDTNGQASSLAPNVLFALASIHESQQVQVSRLVGIMLGSVAGGLLMNSYFPDDAT